MRDLFQVVFELKKKEIELTKQHLEQNAINVIKFHTTGIFVEPTPDTKVIVISFLTIFVFPWSFLLTVASFKCLIYYLIYYILIEFIIRRCAKVSGHFLAYVYFEYLNKL